MTTREAGHRIAPLQAVRALAALAIAVSHFHNQYLQVGKDNTFGFFGIGVDVFFVTSGFIMLHLSWDDFGAAGAPIRFFRRRLARIVPLYWLCTTAFLIHILAFQSFELTHKSWVLYFSSLAFIPMTSNPFLEVGWTLNFEMYFYLVFAICLGFPRRIALLVLFAALTSLIVAGKYFGLSLPLRFWANPIVFEFLLGAALAIVYRRAVLVPLWLLLPVTAVAFIMAYLAYFAPGPLVPAITPENRPIVWGAAATCMVACALFVGIPVPIWIERVGDASYAIYLVHALILYASLEMIGRLYAFHLIVVPTRNWLFICGLVAITVLVSLAIHTWFEKPLTRWLNSLGGAEDQAAHP